MGGHEKFKKEEKSSSNHVWNLQLWVPNVIHLHVEFVKIIYVHKSWIEYHVVLPPSKLRSFLWQWDNLEFDNVIQVQAQSFFLWLTLLMFYVEMW
jgi:hypothetical protein